MPTIKQLPPETRPRERLARVGSSALSDVELIAILLRTGMRNRSALELAQDILANFKGVADLSRARHADLRAIKGVGAGKAAQILAAVELGRRVLGNGRKPGSRLSSPKEVYDFLSPAMKGLAKEKFVVVYLDNKNRYLDQETVSVGILDSAHAHPREVFQGAIAAGAKSLIVGHNHPSGDPTPSKEDKEITKRLQSCGKILGIELLDHIIVGDRDFVSMKEDGFW